jgi:methyltransferase-like protein 6
MISDFWQKKYRNEAGKSWNIFYKRNTNKFFKDRHWVLREFPEILTMEVLFEVGCGVGNFILPLLEERLKAHNLGHLYACDISPNAINILQADPRYNPQHLTVFVADFSQPIISPSFSISIPSPSAIALIFVLSAVAPENHQIVLNNLASLLPTGGKLFFRDYAAEDAAQNRFKADRHLGGRLWVRGDGTFAYYFEIEEFSSLCFNAGLAVERISIVERDTVNAKLDISLERKFLQATLIKL